MMKLQRIRNGNILMLQNVFLAVYSLSINFNNQLIQIYSIILNKIHCESKILLNWDKY